MCSTPPSLNTMVQAATEVEAVVNIGSTPPPQRKGRLPQYNSNTLEELQAKFDELEAAGVFAKPEQVNVHVEYLNTFPDYSKHRFFNFFSEHLKSPFLIFCWSELCLTSSPSRQTLHSWILGLNPLSTSEPALSVYRSTNVIHVGILYEHLGHFRVVVLLFFPVSLNAIWAIAGAGLSPNVRTVLMQASGSLSVSIFLNRNQWTF